MSVDTAAIHKMLPMGSTIFRQGDHGDDAFLIKRGKVRIFRTHEGMETTLATLQSGDLFGEMALFDDRPRSATAEAIEDVELRRLTREEFHELECDPLVRSVITTMTTRLRHMDAEFEKLAVADERQREHLSHLRLVRDWS